MTLAKHDHVLIDSHCHLLDAPLWQKLPDIVQAAFTSHVQHFIVPCSHLSDFDKQLQLCERYLCITPAFGVHPFFIAETNLQTTIERLTHILSIRPQALVGEIGLDFGDKSLNSLAKQQQIDFFEAQLHLAQTHQRPVILHHRASLDAMLQSIKKIGFQHGGFLHAYSGNIQQARPWLQLGFKLGLGSVLLKPNAKKIYQLLPHLNLQDYVVETDAPYMPFQNMPKPYNEPANTLLVAKILADFYQVPWQTIAQNSSQNVHEVLARRPLTSF